MEIKAVQCSDSKYILIFKNINGHIITFGVPQTAIHVTESLHVLFTNRDDRYKFIPKSKEE